VIGTASLVGIYLFANVGYLAALGTEGVAASNRVAAEAVGAIVGPGGGAADRRGHPGVDLLGDQRPDDFSAACLLRDGQGRPVLPDARQRAPALRHAGGQHHRRHAWAMVLAASGTFEQLLTYVVFVGWIFYALGAACVFVLRRTQPGCAAAVSRARLSVDAAAVHRSRRSRWWATRSRRSRPRRGRHRRRAARRAGLLLLEEGRVRPA
jgi:APA family basic amino acid/polyamine antiporter